MKALNLTRDEAPWPSNGEYWGKLCLGVGLLRLLSFVPPRNWVEFNGCSPSHPARKKPGPLNQTRSNGAKEKAPRTPQKKAAVRPSRLFIRVFENHEKNPKQTVTISLGVLKLARSFIPNRARAALEKGGIGLDQVMGLD